MTPVGFDRIAALVAPLRLADPVVIQPPSPKRANCVVKASPQNRTLGATIEYDPASFAKVKQESFWDRATVDRVIGFGIAAHEGQLFGWFNQLLGLLTALGYLTLVVTSFLMWWRRRPTGSLGAPALAELPRLAPFVIGIVVLLGVFLPTLGVSLLGVLVFERLTRRLAPGAARWLGLLQDKERSAQTRFERREPLWLRSKRAGRVRLASVAELIRCNKFCTWPLPNPCGNARTLLTST